MKQDTLANLCLTSSEKYKDRLALAMLSGGEICRQVTYAQLGKRAQKAGAALRQLGVETGGRVLLLAENSPEWVISYFGIALAGAVSVPLLTGFSPEQIQNIASHSGISAVCLSRAMAGKFDKSEIFDNDEALSFSEIPFIYIDSMTETENAAMEITVCVKGQEQRLQIPSDVNLPLGAKNNDLATIIYTSGTQGNSKGVMLSNKNLLSSVHSSLYFQKVLPSDRLLSVLPLAHSYECSIGLIVPVMCGASITYIDKPPSPSVLLPALKLLRPTMMITVPLLIEKIYNNAIAPKLRSSKLYKMPLIRSLAVWFAGRKLYSALGGKIRFFGIGGAPLSKEVEDFLSRAKFPYSIGYGLTEAAPLVSGNPPLRHGIIRGTKAPSGVSIRIVKCKEIAEPGVGEIQVKGPNVMMGYYNDAEKTAEVITSDGWLRTGDLGRLDKKGRLHIRGRLKALILSASGENIYPEEIEGLLGTSALIEDALVYSGEKGELVALVRLSEAARAVTGAVEHILEDLRNWTNRKLAVFSKLSRIEIKHEPFEKTPTMKIKRYLYKTNG